MTVFITLTIAGTDSGPFDLFSDVDGFLYPFETGVSKSALISGYSSSVVPDFTKAIRVKSNGTLCTNQVDIPVDYTTTTTTTTIVPLNFNTTFTCGPGPAITIEANTIVGGSGIYEGGSTYFTSEVAALANTSWTSITSSIGYGVPSNGTYWIVIKDSLGNILAKSVTTSC